MTLGDAYRAVYVALSRVPSASISLAEIKLVDATDPVAASAIQIRDRRPARTATQYRVKSLGDLSVEEVYIYPRVTGLMSRDEVVQTVASLMSRT